MARHDQTAACSHSLTFSLCLMNDFGYIMKIAQLPQTYIVLSSFQGFESLRREIVRGSRNKWFLVIATFSTKQKGWVGIAEWTQPCRTDAPDSATKSPSPVTRFLLFSALLNLYLNVEIWLEYQRIAFHGVHIQLLWQQSAKKN